MFELFVGDIGEYLADIAKQYDPKASLLIVDTDTAANVPTFGTFYTSIGDVGHANLKILAQHANKIHYHPPVTWSDEKNGKSFQKFYTEEILSLVDPKKVLTNLELIAQEFDYFDQDFCQATRTSDDPHLWISGCSITAGVGVVHEDTWKHIVSTKLKLPMVDLSKGSTSILWSADQICLADIKKNDVVFWGLTSHGRLPVIFEHSSGKLRLEHLTVGHYLKGSNTAISKYIPIEFIDSATLAYHNIMAIRRVYNFCKKVGAKLVILGLLPDKKFLYKFYHVPVFKQYMTNSEYFKDIGFDRQKHPGPLSHQDYAKHFLELYSKFYDNNVVD